MVCHELLFAAKIFDALMSTRKTSLWQTDCNMDVDIYSNR